MEVLGPHLSRIAETDQVVNRLYGLTADEIEVVEVEVGLWRQWIRSFGPQECSVCMTQ